jgi:hypothetical protein
MGALNILAKTAKAANEADRALPMRLARATPKTKAEIDALATRVSKQMLGEHVESGKAGDTKNLAGRSRLENERVKGLDYEVVPTGKARQSNVYQARKGDVNVAIPGDQTISDSVLKRVGDIEGIESIQEGGARYGLGKTRGKNPLFWASNEGPAQQAQNKFTDVAEFYEPERVVGQHMAMGPISNNFAMHFADANLRAMDFTKIKPKDMQTFDALIAQGYPKTNPKTGVTEQISFSNWPGIADRDAAMEAMRADPEMRKWFNNRMKIPKVTQPLGLPNGLDIQWAITEPQLRNMEVNLTGLSAGEMVPGAKLTDTAAHNTYEKGIRGKALGHQEVLTPFTLSYPDAAQHIASTQRPQDFTGTIQKVFPHQLVDDQWLDEVAKYRELIKKYTGQKSGGEIHMSNFEKRLRGIKNEDDKESIRKLMALMAGMIKGQPTDVASQTFKGRDYKTKKNPNPTSPAMPSFAFKGKQYAEGGVTEAEPNRFRLPKFGRGGGTKTSKDRPFYEPFTQGLGPMLYGAARGTAAGIAGAPGDIEELGRMGINYAGELAGKPNLVEEEAALPTSERVLKKIPSLKDFGAGKEAQHSEDVASKLGMYGVSQIVAPKTGSTVAKGIKTVGKELGETAGQKIAMGQPLVPGIPKSLTNPPVMNIIKPEGGNWKIDNLQDNLGPLKESYGYDSPKSWYDESKETAQRAENHAKKTEDYTPELQQRYLDINKNLDNQYALDKWIDSNLTNYVKKQMGSEKDPVRLLADEGITHYADEGAMRNALNTSYDQFARNKRARIKQGMPEEHIATTNKGRMWEEGVDDLLRNNITPLKKYGTATRRKENPWMVNLPDDTPFYEINDYAVNQLQFNHILDVLREDLAAGRINPSQLSKVSMKQAVERTNEYNQELAKAQETAKAKKLEGMTIHKDYPEEGYKWVQLNKPGQFTAESNAMGHSVRGYEPPSGHPEWINESGVAGSPNYGLGGYEAIKRGDAKVYSLVDPEGKPHTTIEVGSDYDAPSWYEKHKKILDSDTPLPNDPNFKTVGEMHRHYNDTSESPSQYIEGVQMHLDEANIPYEPAKRSIETIHQIKGKQNRAPESKYLPYVQDFVRSGEWDEISDLQNAGLYSSKDVVNFMPENFPMSRNARTLAIGRAKMSGELPQYMTRAEYEEILKKHAPEDIWLEKPSAPEGEKKGGAISAPKFSLKMGVGGLLKGAAKSMKGMQKVLPQTEREANLQKFLEKSKVKEKMYRGATPHFQKENNPIFVSPNLDFAESFPVGSKSPTIAAEKNQTLYPLHINATNPFDYDDINQIEKVIQQISKSDPDEAEKIKNEFDYYLKMARFGNQTGNWGLIENPVVQDAIKKLGHDSFYVNEEGIKNIGLYDPSQVKSAIGNRGTYDINDPDINKAIGGLTKLRKQYA